MIPPVERGGIRAFFLYDVADTIDLSAIPRVLGADVARAPLQLRPEAASSFIQFDIPPVIVPRTALEVGADGMQVKIFDYGVVSVSLHFPFAGAWSAFVESARRMRRDESLASLARRELEAVLAELQPCLDDPHEPLVEDYFVFEVERFAAPVASAALIAADAGELARLVVGEERSLSPKEQDDVFRVSFSYYEDDLAILGWDNAFVYDANPAPVVDILEFANTQLVELRTYDGRLDAELDRIYTAKGERSAEPMRYLIVDIRELLDRSTNALKFIGDAYYARLYRGAATRLGLEDWQRQIDAKLRSVNEMYRFAQDRAEHRRDTVLELIIILLIVVEVVIGFLTLRH
ncbi:MAG: hypothetical protein JO359_12890 [Candidatus Eremiobacteraeota bacterium]|nr:hypothetical protein [Candidatus Eremiobacteraeota bacterium]